MRTPDAFREDYEPSPDEFDAREDARIDAQRDAQPWWPGWAKTAGIKRPPVERDDSKLF
jgi:hypothetical protein